MAVGDEELLEALRARARPPGDPPQAARGRGALNRPAPPRPRTALLWACVLAAGAWGGRTLLVAARHGPGEFVQYYTSGRAVREGLPVASFYDDETFRSYTRGFGIEATNVWYPNPPTTALLSVPLAGLPYEAGRLALLGLSVLAVVASVALLRSAIPLPGGALPLFVLAVLLFQPLAANLVTGQVYAGILLLDCLALSALRRGRDGAGGLAFALPLAGKLASPTVLVLALVPRTRRLALFALGGALALSAASAALLGLAPWSAFLRAGRRVANDPTFVVTAFQSLRGMIYRVLTRDPAWNPDGAAQAPLLAGVLLAVALLALLGVGLALARHASDPVPVLVYFLSLGIVASPFAQDYTYTPALVLVAVACREIVVERRTPLVLGWTAGLVLLGAPFRELVRLPEAGTWSLLAYPRVWGTLALLLLLARSTKRQAGEAPA